jgi:hypothetical protein
MGTTVKFLIYILVLQKAMASAKEKYLDIFITTIAPILDRLKSVQFGPKLHTKLLSSYEKLNQLYYSYNSVNKGNSVILPANF